MSELDPPEPIDVECPDCGEQERVIQVDGDTWRCLICKDTFNDYFEYDPDWDRP